MHIVISSKLNRVGKTGDIVDRYVECMLYKCGIEGGVKFSLSAQILILVIKTIILSLLWCGTICSCFSGHWQRGLRHFVSAPLVWFTTTTPEKACGGTLRLKSHGNGLSTSWYMFIFKVIAVCVCVFNVCYCLLIITTACRMHVVVEIMLIRYFRWAGP